MPCIIVGWRANPTTIVLVREVLREASADEGALILDALATLAERTLERESCPDRIEWLRDMVHDRRNWCQAWDLEHDSDDYTTVDYHHCPTYVNL